MTSYTFDSNIIIDALKGFPAARDEIRRASTLNARIWISRMVWVEVLSKGTDIQIAKAETFLSNFRVDELSTEIAARAAALRRDRAKLRLPDAIILASAQLHGRILVTRNIRGFPADMPGIRVPYII